MILAGTWAKREFTCIWKHLVGNGKMASYMYKNLLHASH